MFQLNPNVISFLLKQFSLYKNIIIFTFDYKDRCLGFEVINQTQSMVSLVIEWFLLFDSRMMAIMHIIRAEEPTFEKEYFNWKKLNVHIYLIISLPFFVYPCKELSKGFIVSACLSKLLLEIFEVGCPLIFRRATEATTKILEP